MSKYRISFHGTCGKVFKTIMDAGSLSQLIMNVEEALADEQSGHFPIDGKRNRYFTVSKQNTSFIEYEMLLNDEGVTFQSLSDFKLMALSTILESVSDDAIATALSGFGGKESEKFHDAMDLKRSATIKKMISKKAENLRQETVESAQNEIERVALRLLRDGAIENL